MSSYTHRPEDEPFDCALAALNELAGAKLADRGAVLEHGERALYALQGALDEARDEAIGWKGHADEYAAALLELAGRSPADPTVHDPYAAAADVRLRLEQLATDNAPLRTALKDTDDEVAVARQYARWFRHLGTEEPAVDILRKQHGLPAWLEQPWTGWGEQQ